MMHHLACIMDGNRRWAKSQGQISAYGHEKGVSAIETVVQFCLDERIPLLSLFAFAQQNLKRSPLEIKFLFSIVINNVDRIIQLAQKYEIKIRFVGDRSLFTQDLLQACQIIEDTTMMYNQLTLNFLFCYGGQEEIVNGVYAVFDAISKGNFDLMQLSVATFKKFLWTGDIPDPDLIIRTGHQQRLSNFLLFQAAYSELYFVDCLWPELTRYHLQKALAYYQTCTRNFGI